MKPVALALVALGMSTARAEEDPTPCADAVIDPIVTPVRDGQLDAQRGACLRQQVWAGIGAHALIDTPGFHGVLGGGLELGGSVIVAKAHELSAALTLVDYTFVQNAVNKVSHLGYGPVVLGAAANGSIGRGARGALALRVEVPFTDDQTDTLRSSAQLLGVVSGALAARHVLHARLGAIGRLTSSLGGETRRIALVAGGDFAWQLRPRIAVHLGGEVMAGWDVSVDHFLLRAGVHWRIRGAWRLRAGVGAPLGAERTNAIIDLAILADR
jgi:hypothetical protein